MCTMSGTLKGMCHHAQVLFWLCFVGVLFSRQGCYVAPTVLKLAIEQAAHKLREIYLPLPLPLPLPLTVPVLVPLPLPPECWD